MHQVLAHIDRHLDQALELATLAEVAHFSPFHFHRLFTAWMGEPLGQYLSRRRVEVAAMRLAAQPRSRVLDIAFGVGFGSAEAFSRAFRARFGCAPTVWCRQQTAERKAARQNRKPGQIDDPGFIDPARRCNHRPEISMQVKLIRRDPVAVAYLRHLGPYGPALSLFWQNTVYPWLASAGLLGRPRYGISHDDPGITAPAQCRYDACVEVPADFVPVGEAQVTILPGGDYAVSSFKGTVQEIGEAWTALVRDWLPDSGYELDARPCFEHYPTSATFDHRTGVFDCEICVPVLAL